MFRHLLGEEIEVRLALAEGLWPVLADRTQMHQVLLNLLVNARDAMGERGTLTLSTGNADVSDEATLQAAGIKAGQYAWLEVTDSGAGMDRETLQRIFEPFFSTKGEHGTGLGLAIVYGIVKQAQGGILVASEPAAGTRFRVLLPRTLAAAPEPAASARAARPRGRYCVLIIEDQDEVLALARDVLEARGYEVLLAASGSAALAIARARSEPIHLILADVVLRDINGREAAERILELHPESRVLFTSGYPDDEIARRGVSHGKVAFLPKPYTPLLLTAKVAEVLGEPS
jgi:CheY-like chemotaxis protein